MTLSNIPPKEGMYLTIHIQYCMYMYVYAPESKQMKIREPMNMDVCNVHTKKDKDIASPG